MKNPADKDALQEAFDCQKPTSKQLPVPILDWESDTDTNTDTSSLVISDDGFDEPFIFEEPADDFDSLPINRIDNPTTDSDLDTLIAIDKPADFSDFVVGGSDIKFHDQDLESLITEKNITDFYDYIFACQHSNASDITITHAHYNDHKAVTELLSTACSFLDKHAHCTDIRAKWYKSEVRAKTYVKAITAIFDSGEPRVIAISSPVYVYPAKISDLNLDLPSYPISSITELELAIEGLLVLGKLSMANNQLTLSGQTHQNSPRLLIATLSPELPSSSDYEYRISFKTGEKYLSHGSNVDHLDRHIISAVGNDPIHMNLSSDALSPFDTSIAALKRRINKTNKQIKTSSPKSHELLPAMPKPSQAKMWLANSIRAPYDMIWLGSSSNDLLSKSNVLKNSHPSSSFGRDIQNSLLFSNDFLEAFLALSPRIFSLFISPNTPAEDEYALLLNEADSESDPIFSFDKSFLLSLGRNGCSQRLEGIPSIRDLIAKGATSQDLNGCDWNYELDYFHFAKGSVDGVVSYWLYWLMVDVYFRFKQSKYIYVESQAKQYSISSNYNEVMPATTAPETTQGEDSNCILADDSDCVIDEYFDFEEPVNPDDLLEDDASTPKASTIEVGEGRQVYNSEQQPDSDLAIKPNPELVDKSDCDLKSDSSIEVLPMTSDTVSTHDYILAYQDSNSPDISTVYAQRTDQDGVKNLLSAACGFFEKNLSCADIRAKWHKAQSGTKTYVKILTARLGSDEVKVIAVTAPQYFSLNSVPDLESPAYPINTIDDLEAVIEGLLVLGYLSFNDEQLAGKDNTLRDMPKILVATLSADQPDDDDCYVSHDDKVDSLNNRITKVVSNDATHVMLSDNRLSEYTASLSAIKTRLAKANAQIKKASPKSYELLPELAPTTKDKMWLLNMQPYLLSRANLSCHGKVALMLDKSMPHSLLFSNQFLEAFLAITPCSVDLWLEAVENHEDSYCILINNYPSALYPFSSEDLPFFLSLGQTDQLRPVTEMPDIRGLITKGLSLQELDSDDWDHKNQCFNFTKGNLDGIVSYWLYWLIANTYFAFKPVKPKIIEDVSLLPSESHEQNLLIGTTDAPSGQFDIGSDDDFDSILDDLDFDEPADLDDFLGDDDSTPTATTIDAGEGWHGSKYQPKPDLGLPTNPLFTPESNLADDAEIETDAEDEVLVTADNITDFYDYILVYQDSNTLDINTVCATNLDQRSVDHLIATATSFLESTLGCTDIRSNWYVTHSATKSAIYLQTITARIGSENPEIIAIAHGAYSEPPIITVDQSEPISNIDELEAVIAGLVLLGYLSADADYLAANNKTLHDIPKILIATLSPKSPVLPYKAYPTYASSQAPINPEDKYIVSVVSNDPVHMEISPTSNKDFCASVTSMETRLKKAKNIAKNHADRNNASSPKFPKIAEPLQGKVWLLETSGTLSTKEALTRKVNAPEAQKEIQSSLLLSNEFLEAFLSFSKRSVDLVLRAISGSEDSCFVSVTNETTLDFNDAVAPPEPLAFLPEPLFSLNLTPSQTIRHNIRGLIAKGWHAHNFNSSDWQPDGYPDGNRGHLGYFDNVTGTTHGRISHWLYWSIINTYFSIDAIPPMLIKPTTMLLTPAIEETSFLRATNQENMLSLDIGGLSFVVGNALFDLSYRLEGRAYTCSIFKSPPSAGLIASEDTFTAIYLIEGKVFHVHSANTLPEIFTILFDTLLSSDAAHIRCFDVFDIMRDVVDTAKLVGLELKPLLATSVLAV